MQIDLDRRITGDEMIQDLIANSELTVESLSHETPRAETADARMYRLDARLTLDLVFEGPKEEPGRFTLRMFLGGAVLQEYARLPEYLDRPLAAILKTDVKGITLRLWAFLLKVAEIEEVVGYPVEVWCPQSDEKPIDIGLFKTVLLNGVATQVETTAGADHSDAMLVSASMIHQHILTFSEQAMLATLREEGFTNETVDRLMSRYRQHLTNAMRKRETT